MNKNKFGKIVIIVLFIVFIIIGLYLKFNVEENDNVIINEMVSYQITEIPQYNKNAYVLKPNLDELSLITNMEIKYLL
mgnify:CR=1 FL=1